MGNKANRNVIYNDDKHRVNNEKVNDRIDKSVVINDKNNVEIANDFTIHPIDENIIEGKKEVTGYTAGLITRDLVSMGEKMMENKQK